MGRTCPGQGVGFEAASSSETPQGRPQGPGVGLAATPPTPTPAPLPPIILHILTSENGFI